MEADLAVSSLYETSSACVFHWQLRYQDTVSRSVLTATSGDRQQKPLLNRNKLLYKVYGFGNVFDPYSLTRLLIKVENTSFNLGIFIVTDYGHSVSIGTVKSKSG